MKGVARFSPTTSRLLPLISWCVIPFVPFYFGLVVKSVGWVLGLGSQLRRSVGRAWTLSQCSESEAPGMRWGRDHGVVVAGEKQKTEEDMVSTLEGHGLWGRRGVERWCFHFCLMLVLCSGFILSDVFVHLIC